LSSTHVAIVRRCSSVACWAIRFSASPRAIPRASSRANRTSRGASTTITPRYWRGILRLHEQRYVVHDHRTLGCRCHLAEELLADRGVRDRVERLADSSSTKARARAGPGRGGRRPDDVGPEPLGQAIQYGRARLHDLAGDGVGVDDDRALAPSRAATVDLPDPMPPVRPIICTARESRKGA